MNKEEPEGAGGGGQNKKQPMKRKHEQLSQSVDTQAIVWFPILKINDCVRGLRRSSSRVYPWLPESIICATIYTEHVSLYCRLRSVYLPSRCLLWFKRTRLTLTERDDILLRFATPPGGSYVAFHFMWRVGTSSRLPPRCVEMETTTERH